MWEIDQIILWWLSRVGCQTKLAQIWFYWYGLELCSDYLLRKTEVHLFQDDYLLDQLCVLG